VGDIGDKFFLIIFRPGNRVGHVAKGSRQISQLVFALDRDVIVHVSKGILFGRGDNALQGPVDIFCEKQKDDERQDNHENKFHVGNVQNAVCLPADAEPVGDGNNAFFDLPNDDGYSGHYLEGSSDAATISAGDFFYKSGDLLVVGINAMVGSRGNCTPCAPEVHRAYIEKAIAAHPDARFRILLCHVPAYSYVEGAPVRAAGTTSGTPDAPTETATRSGAACGAITATHTSTTAAAALPPSLTAKTLALCGVDHTTEVQAPF
jgi:hypothetical protein